MWLLAIASESDEHPDRVRADRQEARLINYFHTSRQHRWNIIEEIERKAKAICEVTFEVRWKAKEDEVKN